MHRLHRLHLIIDLLFFGINDVDIAPFLIGAVSREVSLLTAIETGQIYRRLSHLCGASAWRSPTTSSVIWGPSTTKVYRDWHVVFIQHGVLVDIYWGCCRVRRANC